MVLRPSGSINYDAISLIQPIFSEITSHHHKSIPHEKNYSTKQKHSFTFSSKSDASLGYQQRKRGAFKLARAR
jgi:hypothetical protein